MAETTPADKTLLGRIGAHESWARTADRTARTEPGRRAADARFEKLVDPDGVLPVEERRKRAASARQAHYQRMALKSAQVRRTRVRRKADDHAAIAAELRATA